MSNYYVSGCVADGDDVSTCDDSVAQFWTLYRRNEEGLSEGIIDCMFREDAEAAMRVYKERDALAAKGMELCREVAHVYGKYNATQMPDMDLVDCQTIQEFSDLAGGSTTSDAYLNSLRADAVIGASAYLADMADGKSPLTAELIKACGRTVFAYGEKLRAGEPS